MRVCFLGGRPRVPSLYIYHIYRPSVSAFVPFFSRVSFLRFHIYIHISCAAKAGTTRVATPLRYFLELVGWAALRSGSVGDTTRGGVRSRNPNPLCIAFVACSLHTCTVPNAYVHRCIGSSDPLQKGLAQHFCIRMVAELSVDSSVA